jgi:hypothetical protein
MVAQQRQNSHQRFKFESHHLSCDCRNQWRACSHRLHRASERHKLRTFCCLHNQIAEKLGGGVFALFFDNLSVHKTKDWNHLFEKLNITEIFNVPYCPQFNGIENYFSKLKAIYKKLLLKCVINDAPYDTIGFIKQSIKSLSNENAKRCVRFALF